MKSGTLTKFQSNMEDAIEQITITMQENSRFNALEADRVASRFKIIEQQLKSIREHEIEDICTMRQLDMQKDFVG